MHVHVLLVWLWQALSVSEASVTDILTRNFSTFSTISTQHQNDQCRWWLRCSHDSFTHTFINNCLHCDVGFLRDKTCRIQNTHESRFRKESLCSSICFVGCCVRNLKISCGSHLFGKTQDQKLKEASPSKFGRVSTKQYSLFWPEQKEFVFLDGKTRRSP